MATDFQISSSILIPDGLNLRDYSEVSYPFYFYSTSLIRAGYVNVEVAVYNGQSMAEVEFMALISDNYDNLTYRIGVPTGNLFTFDNAQVWRGRGMLDLVGTTPSKFYFNNSGSQDADVKVLLGVSSYTP